MQEEKDQKAASLNPQVREDFVEELSDVNNINPNPTDSKTTVIKILVVLVILFVIVFTAYWFYVDKEAVQPAPVINTSQENTNKPDTIKNENVTPSSLGLINPDNDSNHAKIDNSWKRYTNNELGISFSYPEFVSVKAGPAFTDPRFTSLTVGAEDFSIGLVTADGINTDTELLNAYRTLTFGAEYPIKCAIKLAKTPTNVAGIQQIQGEIESKTEECATAGYIFFFFYQQETGQIAKWNIGHDANITSNSSSGTSNFTIYDWVIVDSFRFTD